MNQIKTIAVIGAGTMGLGIAQLCAANCFSVLLCDANPAQATKALAIVEKNLTSLVAKGKLTEDEKRSTFARIKVIEIAQVVDVDLIIEAIIEKLEPKQELFRELEATNPSAILASNTSTFPIQQIGSHLRHPGHCVGLHFFNPPTVMKLVEIISAPATDNAVVDQMKAFCMHLGKSAVLVKDSPGFIVNRVARPFYTESLKVVEEGKASMESVDRLLKASGFKMGPFELMDLIGVDTNLSVTTSLYEAFAKAPRFKPSPIQKQKVTEGKWGKKTGEGFYVYEKN
ncbi:MAG: 3-hydroxyacyl-CoA dehydrogenase family protein [Bacteroidota bacterium]